MRNKIFIDVGGHNGCSVRYFRKEFDSGYEFEIYSFEPLEEYWFEYNNLKKCKLIKKAVWIKDGEEDFYISNSNLRDGSTLFKKKRTGNIDKDNPIKVECIDLSKWIIDNFNEDDYIILKMDIEGAEYKVIDKMIADGSIKYINRIFVDWHKRQFLVSDEKQIGYKNKLKEYIENEEWPNLAYTINHRGDTEQKVKSKKS